MTNPTGGYTSFESGRNDMRRSKNEGDLTSKVEKQTARMPSLAFLSLAGVAAAGSLTLLLSGKRTGMAEWGTVLGNLVPTLLILGLYNKVVKEHEPLA